MSNEFLNGLQAASNAVAGNVAGPVDILAFLLRKAGMPVPENPIGGSNWMTQKGLMAPVRQGASQVIGETAGLLGPAMVSQFGPQIARGLLKGGENLAAPRTLNPHTGAVVYHGSPHKLDKFDSSKIGTGEGAQAYGHGLLNTGKRGQRGAILLGDEWAGKKPPSIEKLARNKDKFLYHSGVADDAANMKYGIEPTNEGPWIREVAGNATDDVDELLQSSTPLAWLSDKPDWVAIKVARKLDKPVSAVTADDIAKHGHLAIINKKSPSVENTFYIPDSGLGNGEQSIVRNMRGEDVKAYTTPLYGETRDFARMEPFGIEKNEFVSTDTVEPMLQLTGDHLLDFLKRAGHLKGGAGQGTRNYVVFPGEESSLRILERNGQGLLGP